MKTMNTEPVNGTVYECPYCHKQMKEDWSHFDEYKRVMLYCDDCSCYLLGTDPKDAYNSIKRKDDKE